MQHTINFDEQVNITTGETMLKGHLVIPENSRALVLFADDRGDSVREKRNMLIAEILQKEGFATLQFNMQTAEEMGEENKGISCQKLAERIHDAYHWSKTNPQTESFNIGLFGFNTGAAAAIMVAARPENNINAVVSLSGRPDLAIDHLQQIGCPVLLIVGGADNAVVTYNQKALPHITKAESRINVLQDSGHGFDNEQKLQEVAQLTKEWFIMHI
jgi:dienelactone hydrolase